MMAEPDPDFETHCRRLKNMYLTSPINTFYDPSIHLSPGKAEVEIEVAEKFFHGGQAVHGSVYFKLLDDSAFFGVSTCETEVFVLTIAFTTYLTRPVSSGRLKAVGTLVNQNRTQFIAESVVYNNGKEVGRGNGVFVRSHNRLMDIEGYRTA